MNLSENQQEWIYKRIGVFFILLGIGWLIFFWDSPISLKIGITTIYVNIMPLGPLFSLLGYLLASGNLKRDLSKLT
ncbi:MAG: hypothetical protein JSW11_11885 [Candidatus Heimdallarchaeota archaeon]|nr:MAG: hypothetical protein JSW11_11885 [Candidatus Heimdallarchaeota archaeon]